MIRKCARLLAVPFGVAIAVLAWGNVASTNASPPEIQAEMQPAATLSVNLGGTLLTSPLLTLSQGGAAVNLTAP